MYISDSMQIMNIALSSNSATGFSSDGFTPNITKYSPTQACKKKKITILYVKNTADVTWLCF